MQLALHYLGGREDEFPFTKDADDGEHVSEGAARRGPLASSFALHFRVDVEQKGSQQGAYFARMVLDLLGGQERVKTDQGCKLFPLRPGGLVLASSAVGRAEVGEVASGGWSVVF